MPRRSRASGLPDASAVALVVNGTEVQLDSARRFEHAVTLAEPGG
jgi:hypothetical protein